MVKSETRRDAEILVRNPSPRLFGKKFRDSKKVKTNHAKTRQIGRVRPFERTIVLQKDSSGYVGFVFKNGKITQIAKDTSAARFVCLLCSS